MGEQLKKLDRRIQRTQQLLRDALMELIVEKGYEAISVQDITDRANVARTTFYLHYTDKEELLFTSMMEIYDDLVANLESQTSESGLLPDGTPAEVVVFRHVLENPDFHRVMLVKPGVAIFINRIRHYLADVFERHIDSCFFDNNIPHESVKIFAQCQAGALMAMVCWWLENNLQPSPEEMAHLFYASGQQGVWHKLGISPPHPAI
jgi:AcrR family transcriptional regulator